MREGQTTKLTKSTKLKLEGDPPNAVFEQRRVEVHEEAKPSVRELQAGEELRLMEARERLDSLHFNDHFAGHQKVQAITRVELESVIRHR